MPATSSVLAPPIETPTEAVPGMNSASGAASTVSVAPPATATTFRRVTGWPGGRMPRASSRGQTSPYGVVRLTVMK